LRAKLFGGARGRVPLAASGRSRLLVPRGTSDKIVARIVYMVPCRRRSMQGQAIAQLKVSRGDNVVAGGPAAGGRQRSKGNLAQRAFDAGE